MTLAKLKEHTNWREFWDERSENADSDFNFDRGVTPRGTAIEGLSERELLAFIDPKPTDVIFDAGCGTGANIQLLHSKAKQIVGMDYSSGAAERCRRRIKESGIENAEVREGNVTSVPLVDRSVDKVVCMSVLQYVDDCDVKLAFAEFARILKPGGVLVLHVKNLSSLYLATLSAIKYLKSLAKRPSKLGYYRTFGWYAKALAAFGFKVIDYNSLELFTLPKMPTRLVEYLQAVELRHCNSRLLRAGWVRRHGAELKIKAMLRHQPES